ncbi:DUF7503 family protein [Halocalculus aciditolerans]|uniref:Uncharacterized protein n=1 Tax=Halocalculus aciditolerans TaxID=1383812 RepID=A0A830FKH1_9EURY|nr:hypothetical protein [Halocalculus aciditolerans]GGL61229.1 hypothetical protein GCM10009039_19260 [Halocalculus aciditolerans]
MSATTHTDYLAAHPRTIGMLFACGLALSSAARFGASNLGTISGP